MLNQLTIGERPNKKNIESLDLTRKGNLLWLWRGKVLFNQYQRVARLYNLVKCTLDMSNIDRQLIRSFWLHKIELKKGSRVYFFTEESYRDLKVNFLFRSFFMQFYVTKNLDNDFLRKILNQSYIVDTSDGWFMYNIQII